MTQWQKLRRYSAKSWLIACFILCALPSGLLMAFITPPGQSPDEPAHFARADGLLRGKIMGERMGVLDLNTGGREWTSGEYVDAGLFESSFGRNTEIAGHPVVTARDFGLMRTHPSDHSRIFAENDNTVLYFPMVYLPATLGLALSLALHTSPYIGILFARVFMLTAFLTLGVLALWLAAFGEAALFAVLILPMTLFLAGSLNTDGVLIGMVALSCAAYSRGSWGYRWLALVLLALFLSVKPPYMLLLAAFALPLFGPGFWARARDAVLAALPVLLWVVLAAIFVLVPFSVTRYHPGPLYAGDRSIWLDQTDSAANLHILLSDPSRFIVLPVRSIALWGGYWLEGMIGILGLSQITMPQGYYVLWGVALAVAFSGSVFCRRPQAVPDRTALVNFLFIGFLLLGTGWLILISLYLDWSTVGRDTIAGGQGRYLIPLLPFVIFAIPQWRGRFALHPLVPAIPAILLGLCDLAYLPVKLAWTFYLH
ncbi:MAG: hypothetical protein B7X08_00475 [Acidocella sp. 20-63-7]|nr:MAG: hypothetical protein B7X08_00475 [Acidocella sp. 20-63-7]HQT46907.1 DUF2142 domain-containing protein [Acidocella sp.]